MQTETSSPSELVLRVLRTSLHVGFAVLLAVGTIRLLASNPGGPTSYLALALAVVLAVIYLAGTVVEKRHSASGQGPDPQRFSMAWLALVTLLWVALSLLSADFSWLAFPLFFLHLHLLGPRHAIIAVTALTAVVVASQWWHSGGFSLPMLLGPMVGAVFAVVMGMAYGALYTEGVNQRLALAELRRTRVELAESQHQAGVLAERERLAREIHDTLAQGLSSIVLVSRAVKSALDAGNAGVVQDRLQTVQETASENLAEARRFVCGLTDPEESLVSSLERVCESTERRAAA
ncbi:sensor histidine kinase [Arthrobacter roseus]|uniref:sensor histidine kinase n=1 Tax=Arthrobacter roseus TaxID=136274 RepID=UPI003083F9A1|nr:signal transduction histidine kinase [Arthrobacter roseus]